MAVLTTENIETHIEPMVRQIVREEFGELHADIASLRSDGIGYREGISTLKSDISTLKDDVFELKGDVAVLKTETSLIREDISSLGVQFEEFNHKLDAIAELVTTTVATRKASMDNTQRIEVLEQAVSVMRAKYV